MSSSTSPQLWKKALSSLMGNGPIGLYKDIQGYVRWKASQHQVAQPAEPELPLSNAELNQLELKELPETLQSKPLLVYAEATSRCNLNCFMCRLSFPETTRQKREHMKLEMFARLEPLIEPGSRISLFGLGEPLLNPDFVEMLRISKARGAFVGLNSNAMLLTERVARAMVDLEQDLLVVSFSGGTRETYERVHSGSDYDLVLANIRRLNDMKLSAVSRQPSAFGGEGSDTAENGHMDGDPAPIERAKPVLQLQFTLLRDNFRELPLAVKHAIDLRCAGLVAMPLTVVDGSLSDQSIMRPELRPELEAAFAEARAVAATAPYPFDLQLADLYGERPHPVTQTGGVTLSQGEREEPARICYEPWQTFYARDDGTVNTCCYSNRVLGDLKTQSPAEIWNGELYRRFRARMRSDNKPSECRVCHVLLGNDQYDQGIDQEAFYDEL